MAALKPHHTSGLADRPAEMTAKRDRKNKEKPTSWNFILSFFDVFVKPHGEEAASTKVLTVAEVHWSSMLITSCAGPILWCLICVTGDLSWLWERWVLKTTQNLPSYSLLPKDWIVWNKRVTSCNCRCKVNGQQRIVSTSPHTLSRVFAVFMWPYVNN